MESRTAYATSIGESVSDGMTTADLDRNPPSLTLVISSLGGGGAERVMTGMANYWSAKGWPITLLTMDDGFAPNCYDLDPRVNRIPLDIRRVSKGLVEGTWNNVHRVVALRRALKRYRADAIICFLNQVNILTLLANRGLGTPIIVSERAAPGVDALDGLWSHLRARTYPGADAIVVQSEGARRYFADTLGGKLVVVPNPVSAPPAAEVSPHIPPYQLVAMGRLSEVKRFDLLIDGFARVREHFPDWRLTIYGEGPQREALEALRSRLGLDDVVALPGSTRDNYGALRTADLFVLSSRYEGFPNALCEAMACGLPVIATDCPYGPREIIRHELDGLLVPSESVDSLAAGLDRLMSNASERARLAARAREVVNRFSVESVMRLWEKTLAAAIERRNTRICSPYSLR